ncbi:MAG: hypothetical protein VX005_00115, partial [Pseudomonadota bacterium]|nr:hypothetical protein [Pseudomonadota bacterium]
VECVCVVLTQQHISEQKAHVNKKVSFLRRKSLRQEGAWAKNPQQGPDHRQRADKKKRPGPMTGTDPKHAYLQATRRLMQQLAAGGLRLGLSHGQLEAGLRDAMLEAAYLQSRRSGGRVTVS